MVDIQLPQSFRDAIKQITPQTILKYAVVIVFIYFVRRSKLPDSYKFLLTIIPSLLLVLTNNYLMKMKHGGVAPIYVSKDPEVSDVAQTVDFYVEGFESNEAVEIKNRTVQAVFVENGSSLWIPRGNSSNALGYLNIANPDNYIKLYNLVLKSSYTLEFWLKLKKIGNSNPTIFSAISHQDAEILNIHYDWRDGNQEADGLDLYVNDTKIPVEKDAWFNLTIVRGKPDTIGVKRGSVYINGIFNTFIDTLPDFEAIPIKDSYLFRTNNPENIVRKEFNDKYTDISNCSIIRFYNRSLGMEDVQNNYLQNNAFFNNVMDKPDLDAIERTKMAELLSDPTIVFYLDCRMSKEMRQLKRQGANVVVGITRGTYKPEGDVQNNKNSAAPRKNEPIKRSWLDFGSGEGETSAPVFSE